MTVSPERRVAPVPSSGVPLSRVDWMAAGQALLCDEGIAGMRLKKLTERLSVSTGSFYHHFVDMDDYLAALAAHFRDDQVRALVDSLNSHYRDPKERMRQLAIHSLKSGLFELDMAMRIWATSDARAKASIQASEQVVLQFLGKAFCDAGFEPHEANLRAKVLLSVRNGHLVTQDERAQAEVREAALALLLQPPQRA
jgi:AcrR family transcriptional regulator